MTVIDDVFCLKISAVHRPELPFGCQARVEWSYRQL